MRYRRLLSLLALCASTSAGAELERIPSTTALHTRVVNYVAGGLVNLRGAVGYQLMIELAPDEQVKNIAVGDSSAWQINIGKQGNRLFLKPVRRAPPTNMTVVTSVRTYTFELEAVGEIAAGVPDTIDFRYPARTSTPDVTGYVDVGAATRRLSKYRITGDENLRPESVSNDGQRTYIEWPRTASIPAIYIVDGSGKEMLVNGMMGTDDVYVVDGVPQLLVFRADRASARAERLFQRKKH